MSERGPGDDIQHVLIGKLIVDHDIATKAQVDECLRIQSEGDVPRPLGTLLRERGYITEEQLALLLKLQKRLQGSPASRGRPREASDEREEDSILALLIRLKQAAKAGDPAGAMRLYATMEEKVSNYLRLARVHVQKAYLAAHDVDEIQDYLRRDLLSCKICGEPFSVSQNGVRTTTFRCSSCGLSLTFQDGRGSGRRATPGPPPEA